MGRPLVVVLLLLTSCSSAPGTRTANGGTTGTLEIRAEEGLVEVRVEVADEQDERAIGLMHREQLEDGSGMVFLWEDPLHTTFWMKNTLIPLSIAFWGPDGRIRSIMDMEPCAAEPCPSYDPEVEFLGALEVNQGFFAEHGVRIGDRVELVGAAS